MSIYVRRHLADVLQLTSTPQPQHVENIKRFRALAGEDQCTDGVLVCRVPREQPLAHGMTAIPWQGFSDWLGQRIARQGA